MLHRDSWRRGEIHRTSRDGEERLLASRTPSGVQPAGKLRMTGAQRRGTPARSMLRHHNAHAEAALKMTVVACVGTEKAASSPALLAAGKLRQAGKTAGCRAQPAGDAGWPQKTGQSPALHTSGACSDLEKKRGEAVCERRR